jgi:hypothetical protein
MKHTYKKRTVLLQDHVTKALNSIADLKSNAGVLDADSKLSKRIDDAKIALNELLIATLEYEGKQAIEQLDSWLGDKK